MHVKDEQRSIKYIYIYESMWVYVQELYDDYRVGYMIKERKRLVELIRCQSEYTSG